MHTHRGTWPLLALILAAGTAEAYTVEQGTLRDGNSQPLTLRGVNWFGFETSDHIVHGLWARNWKDMIAQIKAVGFNAVRIPVCPGTLAGSRVSSVNTTLNPDLAGRTWPAGPRWRCSTGCWANSTARGCTYCSTITALTATAASASSGTTPAMASRTGSTIWSSWRGATGICPISWALT